MKSFDVHIHTNTDCNLQCKHCYNNSGVGHAETMPEDKLVELLELLGRESDIHLEGGEIMLHPDLLSAMIRLPDEVVRHITITTNGTILSEDPDILRLLQRIGCLRISIEGHTPESHGLIRNSNLQRVLYHAARYQEAGVPIVLRITLHAGNRDTLFTEGIPALTSLGFTRFQVYELQRSGRGRTSNLDITGNFSRILTDFAQMEHTADVKLMLSGRRMDDVLAHRNMLQQHGAAVSILEPENSLSISADGSMRVCPWSEDGIIGNAFDMNREQFLEFLEQDSFWHTCGFCSRIRLQKERKYE